VLECDISRHTGALREFWAMVLDCYHGNTAGGKVCTHYRHDIYSPKWPIVVGKLPFKAYPPFRRIFGP